MRDDIDWILFDNNNLLGIGAIGAGEKVVCLSNQPLDIFLAIPTEQNS
jgi:hypothetical protein